MKNLTLTIQEIADLKEGRKSLSEIQKCHVSLKQVRTAITPVIEGFLRNVNYGERIEDWTEDDFQAEMEWYIDKIARFYRDNATKKESRMLVHRADGSLRYPNGSNNGYPIEGRDGTANLRGEGGLFLRNSYRANGTEGMVMPTRRDLEYQINNSLEISAKVNNKGLTLTHVNGNVNTNGANFQGIMSARASGLQSRAWANKRNNGIQKIVNDRNDKKISNSETQRRLKKALINQANTDAERESRNLSRDFANANIPIESVYVQVK